MDLRRLRIGEWTTAAAGMILLIALFLPWYAIAGAPGTGRTAFESFALTDVILLIVALAAIAVVPVTATPRAPTFALAYQSLLWLVTAVAALATLFRLLNPPGDGASREIGVYLGVLVVFGLLATLLVAMRDERLSRPGRPTDATGLPVESVPDIETLPAPRP